MDSTRSEGGRGSAPVVPDDRGRCRYGLGLALLSLALLPAGAEGQVKQLEMWVPAVGEVVYSTYVGGCRGVTSVQDVVVDDTGHTYVVGSTPEDCDRGPHDVFVSKFSPEGERVFERSRLGGHLHDEGKALAVDAEGNIYITGSTSGSCCRPFPLVDPFQSERGGGGDAFVMKLDPSGQTLLYSTFLGGSGPDWGVDVAVDGAGRILVLGRTSSEDFPIEAAHQPALAGGADAFLAVFDPTGADLVFSTYLGGSGDDHGVRMEIGDREVHLVGTTSSSDFPVQGTERAEPLQADYGGGDSDVFLARYSADGALLYATYLGGSGRDEAHALALRREDVYLTGHTDSPDFPTAKPQQPALSFPPAADAFVTRLAQGGTRVRYSTYLATSEEATCRSTLFSTPIPCGGIAVDRRGAAHVTANGLFVTEIAPSGRRLTHTFHGFGGAALALGPEGAVHVAGFTPSFEYPTVNAHSSLHTFHHEELGWLLKRRPGINPQAEFQEDDPRVTTSGAWEVDFSHGHGGGASLRSDEPGAQLVLTFSAPAIRIYGRRGPEGGIVELTLTPDFLPTGAPPSLRIDTYSTAPEERALLWARSGLAGEQTLTLEVTGEGSERAQGASVWFDGFDLE